jgi:hypothetical protein
VAVIDRWRNIEPQKRKDVTEHRCGWLKKRKHHIVLSAVDRARLQTRKSPRLPMFCSDPWLTAAAHIALQVQKANQSMTHNKGVTFLIFDENKSKADVLAELLWDPPSWTDDYYDKPNKQERFGQLIDSAFTVKSHHAGLVQVADVFAYVFRRYCELRDFHIAEEWSGESHFLNECVGILSGSLLPKPTRWPARTTSACAKWLNSLAQFSLITHVMFPVARFLATSAGTRLATHLSYFPVQK